MAKATEDDDELNVSVERMSEESLEFLDQARKGKSRNFVMSVKGAAVRGLVVKKKGIKENEKKDARGQGFQAVHGIVSGSGSQLTFSIAKADGFEEAPGRGKVEKLKKFLSEQTGKSIKAEWVVLEELPELPFDDEDLQHPLVARFIKLQPEIEQACQQREDLAAQIRATTGSIRELLQDAKTIDQAGPKIDDFVAYLSNLINGATAGMPTPEQQTSSTPVSSGSGELAAKLAEGLKRMKPLLEQVIAAHPALKGELVAQMATLISAVKGQQWEQAKQGMLTFGARLKSLLAQTVSSDQQTAPVKSTEELAFAERIAAIEPKLLQAQAANRERATKLGAVWQFALEQAAAKNFPSGNKALDGLEKAIQEILASTSGQSDAEKLGIREGLVDQMRQQIVNVKIRWDAAIEEATREIRKVQDGVREADPQLAAELDVVVEDYAGRLDEVAARSQRAVSTEDVRRELEAARAKLAEIRGQLEQDDVVDFLEKYPFDKVTLKSAFESAFKDLDKQIASALTSA